VTSSPTVLRRPDRLYDGYVFDLDGTVYLGDALLPGAGEVIASVRARGCRTVFLSNNPTRDPQMYADKLGGLGIATSVEDIVNPVVTVPRWIRAHHREALVFVIGEEPLKRGLTARRRAAHREPRGDRRRRRELRPHMSPSESACRSW